jgi:phosphatidate phosphatase APP1
MKNILLIYFFVTSSIFARVIVISDIDDTIKKSNSMGGASQVYYFLKMKSYPLMSLIYKDIQEKYIDDGVSFYYVSAAPDFIYDQDKWLEKKGFPFGESFLRKRLSDKTYEYKMRMIRSLLLNVTKEDTLLFFGDNSSHDPQVYLDIIKEYDLNNTRVFIRDVSTLNTFPFYTNEIESRKKIQYFFSEKELLKIGLPLSHSTVNEINKYNELQTLVPLYTLETLKKRMRDNKLCRKTCIYAEELFYDYY